jgi:hypothetical protein
VILEITIRLFKFVWEILPIQPTIQAWEMGMAWHCPQKCISKYLHTTKELDISRQGVGHPLDLRGENRVGKFSYVHIFGGNGSPSIIKQINNNYIQTCPAQPELAPDDLPSPLITGTAGVPPPWPTFGQLPSQKASRPNAPPVKKQPYSHCAGGRWGEEYNDRYQCRNCEAHSSECCIHRDGLTCSGF